MFVYRTNEITTNLLIYVDNVLLTRNNVALLQRLIQQLGQEFAIKDLGSLHYFLAVEIKYFLSGAFLSQQKYINDLFHKTKMLDSAPFAKPMTIKDKPTSTDNISTDAILYRSVVGALQYLIFTRPDIVYTVNRVC